MQKSETISLDKNEHFGLDPWVQWVSIHTGYPHEIHQIDHLADVKNLKYPQIWETLGEKGFSSGIWSAMNSSKNNAKGCCFFLPDPWTYYENASPEKINDFLALPRYFSIVFAFAGDSTITRCWLINTDYEKTLPLCQSYF